MSKWKSLNIFIDRLSSDINLNKVKLFITKKSINHLEVWYYNKDGEVIKRFFILSKGWVKSMKSYFKCYKTNFYNFDFDNITNFEYFFEDNLDIFMCLNEILEEELGRYKNVSKEEKIEEVAEFLNRLDYLFNNEYDDKTELIKFDSNNTDEDIDNFFDKL